MTLDIILLPHCRHLAKSQSRSVSSSSDADSNMSFIDFRSMLSDFSCSYQKSCPHLILRKANIATGDVRDMQLHGNDSSCSGGLGSFEDGTYISWGVRKHTCCFLFLTATSASVMIDMHRSSAFSQTAFAFFSGNKRLSFIIV